MQKTTLPTAVSEVKKVSYTCERNTLVLTCVHATFVLFCIPLLTNLGVFVLVRLCECDFFCLFVFVFFLSV